MWVYNQNGHVTTPQGSTMQSNKAYNYKSNNSYFSHANRQNFSRIDAKQNNFTQSGFKRSNVYYDGENMRFSDDEQNQNTKNNTHASNNDFDAEIKAKHIKNTQQITEDLYMNKTKIKYHTFFFTAYLIGAILAGVAFGFLGDAGVLQFNAFVASHFEFLQTSSFLTTTIYNIWVSSLSLTLFFLCGLCALGVPLIVLFFILKGIADSAILISFFLHNGITNAMDYILLFGLSNIVLLLCLSVFAITAAKNSELLFNYTCMQKAVKANKIFKKMRGQYLFFLILCVLLSLASTAIKHL